METASPQLARENEFAVRSLFSSHPSLLARVELMTHVRAGRLLFQEQCEQCFSVLGHNVQKPLLNSGYLHAALSRFVQHPWGVGLINVGDS